MPRTTRKKHPRRKLKTYRKKSKTYRKKAKTYRKRTHRVKRGGKLYTVEGESEQFGFEDVNNDEEGVEYYDELPPGKKVSREGQLPAFTEHHHGSPLKRQGAFKKP